MNVRQSSRAPSRPRSSLTAVDAANLGFGPDGTRSNDAEHPGCRQFQGPDTSTRTSLLHAHDGTAVADPVWLPVSDLLDHIGRRPKTLETTSGRHIVLSPASTLVNMIGLERHTTLGNKWQRRMDRAIATGRLRLEHAEDMCDLLGVHPTAVWGWTYFDACQAGADANELDSFDVRVLEPPETEPGGRFCGRPDNWRAIGHERYYGVWDDA